VGDGIAERKMAHREKAPEAWSKPRRGAFSSTSFCSQQGQVQCAFIYALVNSFAFVSLFVDDGQS
jgi:hypothetical protein